MYTGYLREIFIPTMDGIRSYFYRIEEQNIKGLTKELVESILINIEKMFDRLGQKKEKYCWTEVFFVELTLLMIRSKTLKVRSLGTKLLSDMSYRINFNESKFITEKSHKDWLLKNNVMQ